MELESGPSGWLCGMALVSAVRAIERPPLGLAAKGESDAPLPPLLGDTSGRHNWTWSRGVVVAALDKIRGLSSRRRAPQLVLTSRRQLLDELLD